jgi:diacylglycerol kinase family enzyme
MVDDEDLSGEYILLEAMNIRYIGAAMDLAPSATATDGVLDVIAIREAERDAFAEYLREVKRGTKPHHDFTRRARRIEIRGAEALTHIDDEAWPERDAAGNSDRVDLGAEPIVVEVLPGALEVLM